MGATAFIVLALAAIVANGVQEDSGTTYPLDSLSLQGVRLGKDTLNDAIAQFGNAVTRVVGDAHESETTVCFYAKSGTVVTFASQNEFAGPPDFKLTGIRIAPGSRARLADCFDSNVLQVPVSMENGLRLGL